MKKKLGWIYFLQNGKPDQVKIGFTSANPVYRRRALQTGSSEKLRFDPWRPVYGVFKRQEKALHEYLKNFRILEGGDEWFNIASIEARTIVESFLEKTSKSEYLPLISLSTQTPDPEPDPPDDDPFEKYNVLHKKYELLPKWPITSVEDPENPKWEGWSWVVEFPKKERSLLAKTLMHAYQTRLHMQYWTKYGHGNTCWFPDDVYPC